MMLNPEDEVIFILLADVDQVNKLFYFSLSFKANYSVIIWNMEMNLDVPEIGFVMIWCISQSGCNQETRPVKISISFTQVNEDAVFNN